MAVGFQVTLGPLATVALLELLAIDLEMELDEPEPDGSVAVSRVAEA